MITSKVRVSWELLSKKATIKIQDKIKINASNRKKVVYYTKIILNMGLLAAQLVVAEALENKRVAFTVQYIKGSNKSFKEIFDYLCEHFATPGQAVYKDMVDRVLSKALCESGVSLT